ncbi:unnamed protein product, partial [Meganyctiphanes norvegica]
RPRSTMKLLLIGCVLASAYSVKLDNLRSGQYLERTPNNNLVQITYTGVQDGGLYDNSQYAGSERYGYNNQFSNQLSNQVSHVNYNYRNQLLNNAKIYNRNQRYGNINQYLNNQGSQNQFSNQNPRLNQYNQQNQRINQVNKINQDFNQENHNVNQHTYYSQQNRVFNQQYGPFSFNNHQFANPNLVEISIDENRHQQLFQNPNRLGLGQEFQSQENQQSASIRDGRLFSGCNPNLNTQYTMCLQKCNSLDLILEPECRIMAWVNMKDSCWNSRSSMICPVP